MTCRVLGGLESGQRWAINKDSVGPMHLHKGLRLQVPIDRPDRLAPAPVPHCPAWSCNSSCEMGEDESPGSGAGPMRPGEEMHRERLAKVETECNAQISMSVTLKPSTMLSMLRMKVSSFE